MAKSTKAQEVSTGTPDSYTEDEVAGMSSTLQGRPMLGGELKSVGMDSSQSSESAKTSSDKGKPAPLAPAQTMENPSLVPVKETDSDADSTDGDGLKTEEQPSAKPAKRSPAAKARARQVSVDEFE